MSISIVIVEDDVRLAGLMQKYLGEQGFQVLVEHRGDKAIHRIQKEQPDLVILDLMLPKIDGLTVCHAVRQYYTGLVLMLTASHDKANEIEGLKIGADDYLKKPIDPEVLLAHIESLLRRKKNAVQPPILQFGTLKIDKSNQTVYWQNQYIDLNTKEFELLCLLAYHAGRVVTREAIAQALHGFDYSYSNRSIDMTIVSLRKKFHDTGRNAQKIKTVFGKGYLFIKGAWN